MELKQHAAVLALTPTNQLTRLVGAGAQQLDHVGVVHLLEEAVLGEEVLQLVRRVVRLQHLHRHPGTVCVDVDKHINNVYLHLIKDLRPQCLFCKVPKKRLGFRKYFREKICTCFNVL